MTVSDIVLYQILAHLLADFFLQKEVWSRHKRRFAFRSTQLYVHGLVVFILSWILAFQWNFIVVSMIIAGWHIALDGLKSLLGRVGKYGFRFSGSAVFIADQLLHTAGIVAIVMWFFRHHAIHPWVNQVLQTQYLIMLIGYLICLKPTNVFIREVFGSYKILVVPDPAEDLLNAGKLIGNIERMLTLTLILIGQFEAIGFLIAGKSILRYEGKKTSKTEYVLIGSMLSFGMAIMIGVIIVYVFHVKVNN